MANKMAEAPASPQNVTPKVQTPIAAEGMLRKRLPSSRERVGLKRRSSAFHTFQKGFAHDKALTLKCLSQSLTYNDPTHLTPLTRPPPHWAQFRFLYPPHQLPSAFTLNRHPNMNSQQAPIRTANYTSGRNKFTDYNSIYPEDEYMGEMGDNARVWRVYLDETDQIDAELVNSWRSTLDTLLIFAGLFSAVVATFVTQTTQLLQTDNSEVNASLLTELVGLQRAIGTGGNVSAIPESSLTSNTAFKPPLRDVWLNGLWLSSLGLTLMTALITGLIKQWLNYYISDAPGSPKHRACIRQFRSKGVTAWGVAPFVELLPVLMNTSLLLFFVDLILFSQDLTGSEAITVVIITITCLSFAFYLVTSALPIFWPQCPYKTSLTSILNFFYTLVLTLFQTVKFSIRITHYREVRPLLPHLSRILGRFIRNTSLPRGEATSVKKEQDVLEMDVIKEMLLSSPHPVVSSIAAQALAALCLDEPSTLNTTLYPVWMRIDQIFTQSFLRTGLTADKEYELLESISTIERLARALIYSPFCSSSAVSDRLDAFVSMDPTDIRLAAIQAFKLRAHTFVNSWGCVPKRLALIQCFLNIEDIEICRVHPWQRRQLSYAAAVPFGGCSYRDRHTFFPELLKSLDMDKPPLLQQEMLIFLLSPEMIDDAQSYARLPRTGAPLHDLSKLFLRTLPKLVRYARSFTSYDSTQNPFFDLLLRMLRGTRLIYVAGSAQSLRVPVWDHVDIPVCKGNLEGPEAKALARLLQELLNKNCIHNHYWDRDARDRLSLCLLLHRFLYEGKVFNRALFNAVLPWAMALAAHERSPFHSCADYITFPEDNPTHQSTEEETAEEMAHWGRRLRDFIFSHFRTWPPQAFESFRTWIISNNLPSISASFLDDFRKSLQPSLDLPEAASSLDDLFIHFLTCREAPHSRFGGQPDDQQRTLTDIISITSNAPNAKNLLERWDALLRSLATAWEVPQLDVDVQAKPGFHHSNEADELTERYLTAAFMTSPAISVPALLQLIETALNPSAEEDNRSEGPI